MRFVYFIFLVGCAIALKSYYIRVQDRVVDPKCFIGKFIIAHVRGYLSVGKVDPNLQYNLNRIAEADMLSMVYMVPCVKCGDPSRQAKELKAAVNDSLKRYIIDVTDPAIWNKDKTANREFMDILLKELQPESPELRIMTNRAAYHMILGQDYTIPDSLLVLYKPDGEDVCDKITPFGSWKKPRNKLYSLRQNICSMKLDLLLDCDH